MPELDLVLNAFVTLFVIADPVGSASVFLSVTAGLSRQVRRSVALRGVITALAILGFFAVTGTTVLDHMGITIDAFRVAGGLLLFYTAFEMIYARRQERREKMSEEAIREQAANIAVFPLAIPLLAGPGTISATILLATQFSRGNGAEHWTGILTLIGVIGALMLLSFVIFLVAEALDKYLGNTGRAVLTRLLGVLLAALSIQFIADGIRAFVTA